MTFNLGASTAAQPTAKRGRPPKEKLLVSTYKGTSQAPRPVSEKVHKLREDGTSAASPSTTSTDSSPEGEEGSSEEGSDYEDDEMEIDWSKVSKHLHIPVPYHSQKKCTIVKNTCIQQYWSRSTGAFVTNSSDLLILGP